MTDNTVILYALRYAIRRGNLEFPQMAEYISSNIRDISNSGLKDLLQELKGYYNERTDDKNYLLATILANQIKKELYGGDD